MLIAESVLEKALAQVFEGKPAGATMSLAEIIEAWNAVGFRQADLRDAIRETLERHCLQAQHRQGALEFLLTEQGALRFNICRSGRSASQGWPETQQQMAADNNSIWNAFGESWNQRAVQH